MNRFREPVALVEASAFGVAGVIAALLGPWPWLAAAAGPVIFLVVLVIATWRTPKPAIAEQDVAVLVHRWANQLADDHPARAHAAEAVQLVDEVEALILRCERGIAHLDGSAQERATDSLRRVTDFVARSVDSYTGTNSAPVRAPEWSTLARRLQDARKNLQEELAAL